MSKAVNAFMAPSKWTHQVLSTLSKKDLNFLQQYRSGLQTPPPHLKKMIDDMGGWFDQDKHAVIIYNKSRDAGLFFETGRFEDNALMHSSSVTYTAEKVTLINSDNDKMVVANGVVPMSPQNKPRPHLHAAAAIGGALTTMRQGTIEVSVDTAKFEKVWGHPTTPLKEAGYLLIRSMVEEIITEHPAYAAMSDNSKNAITAERWAAFWWEALNSCPMELYVDFHYAIVYHVFRYFKKKKNGYDYCSYNGNDLISRDTITRMVGGTKNQEFNAAFEKVRAARKVDLYWFVGGVKPVHRTIQKDGTLGTAKLALQESSLIRGPDSVATNILFEMDGYSGLIQPVYKRLLRSLGVSTALLVRGMKVDLLVESVGDIPQLASSMIFFFSQHPKIDTKAWRIVVSMVSSFSNIPRDYNEWVIKMPRADAIYVDMKGVLFPSGKKDADFIAASYAYVPAHKCAGFVIYTAIFHTYPFSGKVTDRAFTAMVSPAVDQQYVYKFGSGANFMGIVSTIKDLVMYGYEPSSGYCEIPLSHVDTAEAWYDYVVTQNNLKNSFWLVPRRHYSPISNLLVPPRGKIVYRVSDDGSTLVPATGDVHEWASDEDDSDDYGEAGDDEYGDDDDILDPTNEDDDGDDDNDPQETTASTTTTTVSTRPKKDAAVVEKLAAIVESGIGERVPHSVAQVSRPNRNDRKKKQAAAKKALSSSEVGDDIGDQYGIPVENPFDDVDDGDLTDTEKETVKNNKGKKAKRNDG